MSDFMDRLDAVIAADLQAALSDPATEIDYEPITVRKIAMETQISDWLAMEYGLIPDTRPPVVITRRTRFRWWRQDKIRAVRLRLGEIVAGRSFSDGEDY